MPRSKAKRDHKKVLAGLCKACGHYGDDCTGTPSGFKRPRVRTDARVILSALLNVANDAYPDGLIGAYVNLETGEETPARKWQFDTLAQFIGREIIGVFDDTAGREDNRDNVINALDVAINELRRVRDAMEEKI